MVVLDALLAALLADSLIELERANGWRADALCREYPHLDWFPRRGADISELRVICGRCLVQRECREYAMSGGGDLVGVWGGVGAKGRRLARARGGGARGRVVPVRG